jgi:hypothetical protein
MLCKWFITQVCDQKTFLITVAVSYAFFRVDNGKNSEKIPSRIIFAHISIFSFGTQWIIRGDLKVISMLLGQQGGNTKYPCFLCEWDSQDTAKHRTKKLWPKKHP